MKSLLNYLKILEEEITGCNKQSQKYKELLRKREVVESMIFLIMKNDQ